MPQSALVSRSYETVLLRATLATNGWAGRIAREERQRFLCLGAWKVGSQDVFHNSASPIAKPRPAKNAIRCSLQDRGEDRERAAGDAPGKMTRHQTTKQTFESARLQLSRHLPVLPKRSEKVLTSGRKFALRLHKIHQIRARLAHAFDRLRALVTFVEAYDVNHCLKKTKVFSAISTQSLPVKF